MGEPTKRATLNIFQATKDRMAQRMKYGDTPDKAINALLDIADKYDLLLNDPLRQNITTALQNIDGNNNAER